VTQPPTTGIVDLSEFHEGQKELVQGFRRTTAVTAGQGGGKTIAGYWWLWLRMWRHKKYSQNRPLSWFVGFPTYKLLDRVIITPIDPDRPTLVQFLEEMGEEPQLHITKNFIECISGNVLFGSAENLIAWEGQHVGGCWIDEFDDCPLQAFRRAMERTRFYAGKRTEEDPFIGQVLLTGTPRNVKWIKTELGTPEKPNPSYDVQFIKFPSTANPNYSERSIEEARRILPSWEFRRLYLGELTEKEGGLLFHRDWWKEYMLLYEADRNGEGGNWIADVTES